jgi:DNA-3-methyladenine glycosylase I
MPRKPSDAPRKRCKWAEVSDLDRVYHDTEWGVASRDDRHLFEMLILEGAQAGLSWTTILHKREAYRSAYSNFDPGVVAKFTKRKREQLLRNDGIVRNRLKIEASVGNAKAFLAVQSEFGSFAKYLWAFVGNETKHRKRRSPGEIPAQTELSRQMSAELKQRGFRFVGPTICYAYMQAAGLVNDHEVACFRFSEIQSRARPRRR